MQKLPQKRHLTQNTSTNADSHEMSNNNNSNIQHQQQQQQSSYDDDCGDGDDCGGGCDDDKLSDKRRSRNENEKKRRDQFNELIDELANLLNHEHKIDKSTTLFETLNFFKNNKQVVLAASTTANNTANPAASTTIASESAIWNNNKPGIVKSDEFINLMCEFRKCFYIAFEPNGCINYVSENITNLLGYNAADLKDKFLFDYIDEKSSKAFQSLIKKRKFNAFEKFTFQCNWKLSNTFKLLNYEAIKLNGFFKRNISNNNDSKVYFVALAVLDSFLGINEIYSNNAYDREFTFELSMDWKYTNFDKDAENTTGYASNDMIGTSGYDYCHFDDLESLIECHRLLLKNGASTSPIYRFRTKGQQWIYLQTHYTLVLRNRTQLTPRGSVNSTINTLQEPQSVYCNSHLININDSLLNKSSQLLIQQEQQQQQQQQHATLPLKSNSAKSTPQRSQQQQSSLNDDILNKSKSTTSRSNSSSNNSTPNYHTRSTSPSTPSPCNDNKRVKSESSSASSSFNNLNDAQQQQQQQKQQSPTTNTTPVKKQMTPSHKSSPNNNSNNGNNNNSTIVNNKLISRIILMSYQRPEFRQHVCTQFLLEKQKVENEIKKHQDRYKQFDEIINFFQDDKKLENWVSEVKNYLTQNENNPRKTPSSSSSSVKIIQNNNNNNTKSVLPHNSPSTLVNNNNNNSNDCHTATTNNNNNEHNKFINTNHQNGFISNHNNSNTLQHKHHHHHHHQHQQQQQYQSSTILASNNMPMSSTSSPSSSSFSTAVPTTNTTNNNNNNNLFSSPNQSIFNSSVQIDNIDIDDIDVEVLDRLLCEYSFKSLIF